MSEDFPPPNVENVTLGLIYSCVKLADNNVGVSHSLINFYSPDCFLTSEWGDLSSYSLLELIDFCKSNRLIDRVIGIAALNSYSQHIFEKSSYNFDFENDIIDKLNLSKSDKVGMVGRFTPLIPKIVPKIKKLTIIEIDPKKLEAGKSHNVEIINDPTILEEVDVAIITATSLINQTIDELLKLARASRIAIVGPTMGMLPGPFFKAGVSIVGGMKFLDANKLLRIISQGGGTKRFKNFAKKSIIEEEKYSA